MTEACKTPCLVFRTKDDVLKDPLWADATVGADTRETDLDNIVKVWGAVPWLAGPEVTTGEIEIPGYPPFCFDTVHLCDDPESLVMYMECVLSREQKKALRYMSPRITLENYAACLVRNLAFFLMLAYVAGLLAEKGILE